MQQLSIIGLQLRAIYIYIYIYINCDCVGAMSKGFGLMVGLRLGFVALVKV